MRILILVALSFLSVACEAHRYQQVANPPLDRDALAAACTPPGGTLPAAGCGLTILDTQTGTIFIREPILWREENPHTGNSEEHPLH